MGIQSNMWAYLGSDPVRTAGIWAQQLTGVQGQYLLTHQYSVSEKISTRSGPSTKFGTEMPIIANAIEP